jgi:demethylmenaquinone methyltransferase/2-methoxy-6-polyprenyl-1,4-benzoquinol methylase
MFDRIAGRYDRANQWLSFGLHHRWRAAAVARSGARPGESVLDVATGTGDLAIAFARRVAPGGKVVGVDFVPRMIELARAKSARRGARVEYGLADALALPFANATFDIASIAFGIRNLDDPARGLAEMARVLRPGGRVVVLEFGQPTGVLFAPLYRLYSRAVMPLAGRILTGEADAYRYLPETAERFPFAERFLEVLRGAAGFARTEALVLTGGVAYVYVGTLPGTARPAGK